MLYNIYQTIHVSRFFSASLTKLSRSCIDFRAELRPERRVGRLLNSPKEGVLNIDCGLVINYDYRGGSSHCTRLKRVLIRFYGRMLL